MIVRRTDPLGGRAVPCDTLDDSYCDVCEALCAGQRCVGEVGCAPLSDVDGPCERDRDCRTDNCSRTNGVCRVPLETECNGSTDCDICLTNAAGYAYCSRECTFDSSVCPGERCLGDVDSNFFWCRPPCNDACAGRQCRVAERAGRYCSANLDRDLARVPLLGPCGSDERCLEGACFSAPSCDDRAFNCLSSRGVCTQPCSSDAQCPSDARCVEVPCPEGTPADSCGALCLRACERDSDCNELAQTECRGVSPVGGGEAVSVCDPRNRNGDDCAVDWHCASRNCTNGRCVQSEGLANGAGCRVNEDCASGNCQAGTCRGTSLRGDFCEGDFDCSVGRCVDGVCT